jgi:hypothetical protein
MQDSELIIRTRKSNRICELIPNHALVEDFPYALVQGFAHCLDIQSGEIEWRPLPTMWNSSSDNWLMRLDSQGKHVLSHGKKMAIDIRSRTAQKMSRIFSPIEQATHMHVSYDCEMEKLEIELPRMKLDFTLNNNRSPVMSKQFRGMSVDNNQALGTFTGLVNKLVLVDIVSESRCVIVPNGNLIFSKDQNHVKVMIDCNFRGNIKYHSYQIDNRLGRLVDNGSLQSKLFKSYLHATTSHCLVDQLTGRTGTEEALDILRGAAVRSFIEIQDEELELLGNIAQLTPRREFYPKHLQVMQQTEWKVLPPLSQHSDFVHQVDVIFGHARSNQLFQENPSTLPDLDKRGKPMLRERAAIREAIFQVDGFGAQAFSTNHDTVYESRDTVVDGIRELQVCHISTLVDKWSSDLKIHHHLLSEITLWARSIRGPHPDSEFVFGFNAQWLTPPAHFFQQNWCVLHDFLGQSTAARDRYRIMVLLSKLSYSFPANQDLIQTLLALATVAALRISPTPSYSDFTLADGYEPIKQRVLKVIERHCRPFKESPDSRMLKNTHESKKQADRRRTQSFQREKEKHVKLFTESLVSQWPTWTVRVPTDESHRTYISVNKAVKEVRPLFQSWHRNLVFRGHIGKMQEVLDRLSPRVPASTRYTIEIPTHHNIPPKTYVEFSDLTSNPTPRFPNIGTEAFSDWIERDISLHSDHNKLQKLLDDLEIVHSTEHEKGYSEDLIRSFNAMQEVSRVKLRKLINPIITLKENLKRAQTSVKDIHRRLCSHLQKGISNIAKSACMVPRLSSLSILSNLSRDRVDVLPSEWKKYFVQYGLAIADLQRAGRLLAVSGRELDLLGELQNTGHQDWDPCLCPDWLLFELENDIFIRQEQAQLAQEMMAPASASNSVMQLNMGQGKSSVIIPIIAAALANSSQLVRVIVLKPLAMQMFQLLVAKLGGLLQRRIVYMPISRSLRLSVFQARQIREVYEKCMKDGAILLLQPEHILSFELMGFEHLASGNEELGTIMSQTQDWLYKNSRDVLDESDEILSVRFELIYTMGIQRAIDFSPERWQIIQKVLELLPSHATEVQKRFPTGLELMPAPAGAVARIRILEPRASEELLSSVAQRICDSGLPSVPVWNLPEDKRRVLFKFLTDPTFKHDDWRSLRSNLSASMNSGILLLKGLFAGGLLRFAFEEKRWRVNFGLDLSRTILAVPYHAKDTPSPRAEFSHPDTAIILTCLSYYYGSLSNQQLTASFEALLNIDNAQEEYASWVKDAPNLPIQFRNLDGINLSNPGQCAREVFPILKCARSVINFYLSAIVFPTDMREFPQKLSSSGWDIAREKGHPTTGFSGTNDSRYVLPLSIKQCDLPKQLPTNAAVLDCLLRPENAFLNSSQISTTVLDAEAILATVVGLEQPARVILDVGAQVLELRNEEFARVWLSRTPTFDAQAVIFFNARDEICVLSRDGRQEPLAISPFAKQMDQCLVYLDESHTRGTDLKLPANYRALVTLGPSLTKDRLVQGTSSPIMFLYVTNFSSLYANAETRKGTISHVLRFC